VLSAIVAFLLFGLPQGSERDSLPSWPHAAGSTMRRSQSAWRPVLAGFGRCKNPRAARPRTFAPERDRIEIAMNTGAARWRMDRRLHIRRRRLLRVGTARGCRHGVRPASAQRLLTCRSAVGESDGFKRFQDSLISNPMCTQYISSLTGGLIAASLGGACVVGLAGRLLLAIRTARLLIAAALRAS
jgi:hypothetical protein